MLCVALDQRVAKIILDYAEACFERSPILRQLIANRTADALELTNGITLEVRPASFRKLRGPTYIAVIADELAFWYVDAAYANPDVEILNAVEPGLATTGGPLILASSPHARRGALWDVFKRHYGAGGDPLILVAHGATRTLNPSLPQRVVDRALEKDRARASAEYLAEFRTDIEGFVSLEVVEACVSGYHEIGPRSDVTYRGFIDPSGGSEDSMTLAIAHKTPKPEEMIVIDVIREARPPFSPEAVVDEFAALCKLYRITKITGDHFGGEFVKEPFRRHGLSYELAKQPKSDLYRDLLPLLNSGRIMLPKHDRLVSQIVGLERRVSRAGKDSIDHAPHGHDDLANAVAGVADATRLPYYDPFMGCGSEDDQHPPPTPGWKLAGFGSKEEAEAYKARRSCATWQVRFISVGRLFWVSHEHVSTVAFNRHAIGVSPPRRGAAATGRALAVLASDRVRARRHRSDRRRGGEGGRGGDYGCRCTEIRKCSSRRTKRTLVRNMAGPFHFRGTAILGKSMSTFRPLHLTDTQLASVRRAAALLRPAERSQFLQAIAYELADIDPIDDEAVRGP